jgi:hypothetical protein
LEEVSAYHIFITTTGSLYRCDINDVIKVTGRCSRTPQIVFLRKGRGMTNITGEKVSVNPIISSIQLAAEGTHVFRVPPYRRAGNTASPQTKCPGTRQTDSKGLFEGPVGSWKTKRSETTGRSRPWSGFGD